MLLQTFDSNVQVFQVFQLEMVDIDLQMLFENRQSPYLLQVGLLGGVREEAIGVVNWGDGGVDSIGSFIVGTEWGLNP